MKEILKYEDFVLESINKEYALIVESFNSSILQKISSNKDGGIGKAFYDTLSKMGVAASEITNLDILALEPDDAHKHAKNNPNDILIYYSEKVKDNPYSDSYPYNKIQADVVLAVVKGKNWMGLRYDKWASKGGKAEYQLTDAGSAGKVFGIGNFGKGKYDSGITSFAKIAEISDVVYAINLESITSRTEEKRNERKVAKEGAIAFKDDKQFKKENQSRYEAILRERASNTDIDKIVQEAIDLLTDQIKAAIVKNAKTSYGDVLIGIDPKGREIRMSDASNQMSNILSDYGRYSNDMNSSEKSKERWGEEDSYYTKSAQQHAKNILDRFKKIKDMNYAW